MPQTKLAVAGQVAPAPPTDWRHRERALLDRCRQLAADLGALEAGRVRLQVAMAGVDDPAPAEAALAKFRAQAADLANLNRTLTQRVEEQIVELERIENFLARKLFRQTRR